MLLLCPLELITRVTAATNYENLQVSSGVAIIRLTPTRLSSSLPGVQCLEENDNAMLQDKEEKERLMVSKAPLEESDKELNSGGEEIIELQEMRVSPIPSLRNRHKQKYYKDPRGEYPVSRATLADVDCGDWTNELICLFQGLIKASLQVFVCTETIHFL